MNNLTPMEKIISNCRIALDENIHVRYDNVDLHDFDVVDVLSVAFKKDNIIDSLSKHTLSHYTNIDENTYEKGLNNLSTEIKNKNDSINIELITQVISIAFLKSQDSVFNDFIEIHSNNIKNSTIPV